jgi:hypothetical protein
MDVRNTGFGGIEVGQEGRKSSVGFFYDDPAGDLGNLLCQGFADQNRPHPGFG